MSVFKEYVLTIDTMKDLQQTKNIIFSQNDRGTAKLKIYITHNDELFDLTGSTVKLALLKSDGTRVYQDCEITDAVVGEVVAILTSQSLVKPGAIRAEMTVDLPGEDVIVTNQFTINVKGSIMGDDAIESTNEFAVIQKAIDAGEILSEITDLQTIVDNTTNVNNMKSEIEAARGTETDLSARLGSIESTVSEKANSTDLTEVDTRLTEQLDKTTSELNEKAPQSEIARIDLELTEKARQSDLEVERARISNLTANAGNTDGNAELLDIRVGFDGVTYPTAGESTRAIINYMEPKGNEHTIFPPGVTGLPTSTGDYKGSMFQVKKNRKLTYVGAKGNPISYELSEVTFYNENALDQINVISSGSFQKHDENGYAIHELEIPVLLKSHTHYLLSVYYGADERASYVRTKALPEYEGYDPNEDDVILVTGKTVNTTTEFPKTGMYPGVANLFYYDYKIGVETYEFKVNLNIPEPIKKDPLEGMNVGLLGSSTMDTSRPWKNFMMWISERTGLVLKNYAVGGSSTTSKIEDWQNDTSTYTIGLKKTLEMTQKEPDLDLILCQPLINDEYLPLGDFSSTSPTTCYGAMHIIAKMLLETYPEKPIGFITGQYIPGANDKQHSLRHACIKEIGAYYGIPVLDLRAEGQTPYMLESFKTKYVPDGTHLNDAGNKIVSRRVEAFIRMLMTGYSK